MLITIHACIWKIDQINLILMLFMVKEFLVILTKKLFYYLLIFYNYEKKLINCKKTIYNCKNLWYN